MKWYQRVEIWVLAAAVAGVFFFVFGSGGDDLENETEPVSDADVSPTLIHRSTIERDHGNARLDLEIGHANRSAERLVMQPPRVKLFTGKGREVPPFFLPFDPPPAIPAKSRQDVRLRYWLEKADLDGALTLEIDGERVEVKSSAAFDLEKLENKKTVSFKGAEWK